jgi:hypothetical protein
MTNAALMTHLKVLDDVKLEQADYETIGKMFTAMVLRDNEQNIKSSQPDAEGHVRLEGTLRYIVKLHSDDGGRIVCCECACSRTTGDCVCIGDCCTL